MTHFPQLYEPWWLWTYTCYAQSAYFFEISSNEAPMNDVHRRLTASASYLLKAAFHYSNQQQTCFWPGLQPGFRQVRAGLRHAFDQLSTFFVAADSLVRARARQMERRKNPFKQVRSWLSTCLRPGFRPGLQLARIMECGLNCATIMCFMFLSGTKFIRLSCESFEAFCLGIIELWPWLLTDR